jgi:hypothetical protein
MFATRFIFGALLGAISTAASALESFSASYSVTWRGMAAGRSELTLLAVSADQWSYTSVSHPRGLFKMALPGAVRQRSEFVLRAGEIIPLHFTTDDGSPEGKRDTELRFDWAGGRVHGTAEMQAVDLPLEPGLQDSLSIQVALMNALIAGRAPTRFQMLDRDRIKEYLYTREGEATVQTPLGPKKTVLYRSARPGATRGTWFWCAPELNYLPVKVERRNGNKVEWSMALLTAKL